MFKEQRVARSDEQMWTFKSGSNLVTGKPRTVSIRKIRILLIEDNRLLREGITTMLNEQADMKVVAASGGHEKTLLNAVKLKAQLILVDMSGLRVAASLVKKTPQVKVIGMGLIPAQSDIVEFVQAGASGFIMKGATPNEFLSTIRSVAGGEKVLPPSLAESLFSHVVETAFKKGSGNLIRAVRMTNREREIIALIGNGLSNKEIAQQLNIATYTVKSHVHNILEKLALHNRIEIAKYTYEDEAS
jgi:DNA-binding NarL/FixJ family response regulator